MNLVRRIGNTLGFLALAATFALASPGVSVVQAETVAERSDAAQCNAGQRRQSQDAKTDAFIEQLRTEHGSKAVADLARFAGAERFQVLNNRGYNYGTPPGVAVDTIMAEVEAAR